jgi:hypothetical protein
VDESVTPERQANVRGAATDGFEEQEVSRLDFVEAHLVAGAVLIADLAWQRGAVTPKHVLNKPAAVESRGFAPAVSIGDATKAECRFHDERGPRCGGIASMGAVG